MESSRNEINAVDWYEHPKCKKSKTGRHSWYVKKQRTDDEHCCRLCGYVTLKSAVHIWASDEWIPVNKKVTINGHIINGVLLN